MNTKKKLSYQEKYEKARKQLKTKQKALKAKALKYMAAELKCRQLEAEINELKDRENIS